MIRNDGEASRIFNLSNFCGGWAIMLPWTFDVLYAVHLEFSHCWPFSPCRRLRRVRTLYS